MDSKINDNKKKNCSVPKTERRYQNQKFVNVLRALCEIKLEKGKLNAPVPRPDHHVGLSYFPFLHGITTRHIPIEQSHWLLNKT